MLAAQDLGGAVNELHGDNEGRLLEQGRVGAALEGRKLVRIDCARARVRRVGSGGNRESSKLGDMHTQDRLHAVAGERHFDGAHPCQAMAAGRDLPALIHGEGCAGGRRVHHALVPGHVGDCFLRIHYRHGDLVSRLEARASGRGRVPTTHQEPTRGACDVYDEFLSRRRGHCQRDVALCGRAQADLGLARALAKVGLPRDAEKVP